MSETCPTCRRPMPREMEPDEVMVRRIVDHGKQPEAKREDRKAAVRVLLERGQMTKTAIAEYVGVELKTITRQAAALGLEPAQRVVTSEVSADIARRYGENQTVTQIACAVGLHESTVRDHLRKQGVVTRRKWKGDA